MKKIVIDTSFLLHCLERKVDPGEVLEVEGFVPVIPATVLRELQILASGNPLAKLALVLIRKRKWEVVEDPPGLEGDPAVVALARSYGALASSDRKMRKNARAEGIEVFTLRKGRLWKC